MRLTRKLVARLSGSKGGAVMPVMAALAAVMLGSIAVVSTIQANQKVVRAAELSNAIRLAAFKIQGHVNNDVAWAKAIESPLNSAALGCVLSGGNCCAQGETDIAVFDQAGTLVYDHRNVPTMGFTTGGETCNAFPSRECPIRLEARWQPSGPPPCHDARIRLVSVGNNEAGSQVATGSRTGVESGLVFMRGQNEGSIAQVCKQMKGLFDQTRNQCLYRMAFAEIGCAGGSCDRASCIAMGGRFNPARSTCLAPNTCAEGTSITGFDSNTGALSCSPIPAVGSIGDCPDIVSGGVPMPSAIRAVTFTTAAGAAPAAPECVPHPILPDPSGNCPAGRHLQNSSGGTTYCFPNTWACPTNQYPPRATYAEAVWDPGSQTYPCRAVSCIEGWVAWQGTCLESNRACNEAELAALPNATSGNAAWNGSGHTCTPTTCADGFTLRGNQCLANTRSCAAGELPAGATGGTAHLTETGYWCQASSCGSGYRLENGTCVAFDPPCPSDQLPYGVAAGVMKQDSTYDSEGNPMTYMRCFATACNPGFIPNGSYCTDPYAMSGDSGSCSCQ